MDYQVYYELIPFFLFAALCYLAIKSNEYIQVRKAELKEETKQKAKENYLQNDLFLQKMEMAHDFAGAANQGNDGLLSEVMAFAQANPEVVKQLAPKIKATLDNMKTKSG